MSLQVWLPYTSDIKNYGLATLPSITSGSMAIASGGKLGYSSSGYAVYHCSSDLIANNCWTISTWINRISTFGQYNDIICCKNASSSDDVQFYLSIQSYGTKLNCGYNTGSDGIKYNYTFSINTWYHIAVTYSGSKITLFLNGNEVATASSSKTKVDALNLGINTRASNADGTSNYGNCGYKLNDYRLYDTCLSAQEVRDLAKGLIVHYPLNNGYFEPTTNLCHILSSSCYNGATGKYNYGSTTDIYKTDGTFQGKSCTKVYMGTAGNSCYPYIFFDSIHPGNGAYKTLSFDFYPTNVDYVVFYTYNGSATVSYISNYTATGTSGTVPVKRNQWNHIEFTLYGTSTNTSGWGYMRIGTASHTSTTTDYWLVANIMTEAKNHATPYDSGTRDTGVIYDCSGYKNNATPSGDVLPIVINSSPRYYKHTYINSTNAGTGTSSGISYIRGVLNSQIVNPTALTISWWSNMENWAYQSSGILCLSNHASIPSDYQESTLNQYDGSFRVNMTNGNANSLNATTLISNNAWHHYAIVIDGATAKSYRDGTLIQILSTSGTVCSFQYIYLGWSHAGGCYRTTSGKWSDFRIYATALPLADIQDLYNAPIKISSNGTLITNGEVVE